MAPPGRLEPAVRPPATARIVRTVHPVAERELPCPRCRYDLRAVTEPRCPECGLGFSWESWRSGAVRDERPSLLDTGDLMQPQCAAWRSLIEMLRNAWDPASTLVRLRREGRPGAALAAFAGGMAWLALLSTALLVVATLRSTCASPHAAVVFALADSTPRLLALAAATSLCALVIGACLPWMQSKDVSRRAWVRLAAHGIPSVSLYSVLGSSVFAAVLPDPVLASEMVARIASLAPLLPVMFLLRRWRDPWQRFGAGRLALLLGACAAWVLIGQYADRWLGEMIEPALWAFPSR